MLTTFKSNKLLERGFITGIHRIAKEALFTALPIEVRSIKDGTFCQSYALTEEDAKELLQLY
jgi:hypothetical protein